MTCGCDYEEYESEEECGCIETECQEEPEEDCHEEVECGCEYEEEESEEDSVDGYNYEDCPEPLPESCTAQASHSGGSGVVPRPQTGTGSQPGSSGSSGTVSKPGSGSATRPTTSTRTTTTRTMKQAVETLLSMNTGFERPAGQDVFSSSNPSRRDIEYKADAMDEDAEWF